ncbi:hypothetical protein ACFOY4_01335 [Actinomadura syzygii]|uniref:Uncharacterized protein n=1 Tax=Actinomadura syzygii TaxID=1427538 RepID=A0A5D0TRY6_9ACTN|nr:hypothetical protein [Actinomadura syzygii]TYC08607.1 hypothetical protein FXF65_37575 [Actinomadura syzygii]
MSHLHRIDLPGLAGDEPLGFLAVIGLMSQLLENSYLSWDPEDRHAILHCHRPASIADLVAELMKRLRSIPEGGALPYSSNFPVRRRRGAPDPLRVTPDGYRRLTDRVRSSWLRATLTDKSTDADGRCLVNPLIAVRGRQTIGSFWYYPMLEVRRDPERLLTEALTGWRRVQGSEGWWLDHRASYSTDPGLRGPGGSMAVPGATWLATLAVEKFSYPDYGSPNLPQGMPRGWFPIDGVEVFAWPLWTLPASKNTLDAVWNVGWDHGSWEFAWTSDGRLEATISATHGVSAPNSMDHVVDLDIFAMCAAARPQGGGPLTPIPVQVRRVPSRGGECQPWKGWDWKYPDRGEYPGKYGWG